MKIVFICGSLEPGRDGVGDYTRKLAAEMLQQGHEVGLVALNDGHLSQKIDGLQTTDNTQLPALRLPATSSPQERFALAKSWIDEFDPQWLSLQFVLFSFHPKGLPFGLQNGLAMLGKGKRWHIMFHELWVGMAQNDTVKRKLWGLAQKQLIKALIQKLKPAVIHSQCDLYIEQLRQENYGVKKLVLFSNIDVYDAALLQNADVNNNEESMPSVRFVFFGGLHPGAKLDELVYTAKEMEARLGSSIEFLYIGRNGLELENHLSVLTTATVHHRVLGELSRREISCLLSSSTIGVTTSSPQMLEKNGTVAAMRAHKLPVLCIGRNLRVKRVPEIGVSEGIYFLKDVERLLQNPPVLEAISLPRAIAKQFSADLQSN